MRWSLAELYYELDRDPARKVVFVEGEDDRRIWEHLVPVSARRGTQVYPIGSVSINLSEGGERGRLLFAAKEFGASKFSDRVTFFADADADRVLGRAVPGNVILTDGRDLECYVLCGACLNGIVSIHWKNAPDCEELAARVRRIARPIALLRLASDANNWKLPFQRTLELGVKRFVRDGDVDQTRLILALLQNAGLSLKRHDEVVAACDNMKSLVETLNDDQILHGKDLIAALAVVLNLSLEEAARVVLSALLIGVEDLRSKDNIAAVSGWMTS